MKNKKTITSPNDLQKFVNVYCDKNKSTNKVIKVCGNGWSKDLNISENKAILSAKIKVDLYPVPMTLQPLAVLMIAMLCGRNISVAAVSLYLLQGIVGIPVFAYGGGLPYLLGPTGGFLFGFLFSDLYGHLHSKRC